ncbi:hypothetical protein AVEN_232768-1 [Araneus ventricosus]|uniref:Uncharacterized protein n=1 Tax=Araneus ventricosus TaxID=182803 RepID=A0A4Y2KIT0_ARAVE|nr:hypothetical protein AVEN_232768-1 [Araneus ventricosus]
MFLEVKNVLYSLQSLLPCLRLDIHDFSTPRKFGRFTAKPVVSAKKRLKLVRCSQKFGFPTSLKIQLLYLDYWAINAEMRPVYIHGGGGRFLEETGIVVG